MPCIALRRWRLVASRGICQLALRRAKDCMFSTVSVPSERKRTLPDSIRVLAIPDNGVWQDPENMAFGIDGSNLHVCSTLTSFHATKCQPSTSTYKMQACSQLTLTMVSVQSSVDELPQPLGLQRRAHVLWQNNAPSTVLIVKKPNSVFTSHALKEIGEW